MTWGEDGALIVTLKGVRNWSTSDTRHDYALALPVEMASQIIIALANGAEPIAAKSEDAGELLDSLLRLALPAHIEHKRRQADRLVDIDTRLAAVEAYQA